MARRLAIAIGVSSLVAVLCVGCGSSSSTDGETGEAVTSSTSPSSSGSEGKLTESHAVEALNTLPYRYQIRKVKPPPGASSAIAGEVHGPADTDVGFAVALGSRARPVPLPRSGTTNVTFVPSAGFTFINDLLIEIAPQEFEYAKNIRTQHQLHVAVKMMVKMEEALCLEATGKKCGI